MVARKKGSDGRFVPEDTVPELPLERYLNTMVVDFAFAADSSNADVTSFKTGMEIESDVGDIEAYRGRKWALYGAVVAPMTVANGPHASAADLTLLIQLRYPDTAGSVYNRGNRNVIAQYMHTIFIITQGCHNIPWPQPLYIPAPKPVIIAPDLEIVTIASVNDAGIAGKEWQMELTYGWAEAHAGDLLAANQVRPSAT